MSWIWPFPQSLFKLFPLVQVTGSRIGRHSLLLQSESTKLLASRMHFPLVWKITFQHLMETTQQEGLTGSCLGTRSRRAIKAFSWEKLAMAASTVRNTECKCSLTEQEFEKNLKPGLLFIFPQDKEDWRKPKNMYSLVITYKEEQMSESQKTKSRFAGKGLKKIR